jgi:hypothetical protein
VAARFTSVEPKPDWLCVIAAPEAIREPFTANIWGVISPPAGGGQYPAVYSFDEWDTANKCENWYVKCFVGILYQLSSELYIHVADPPSMCPKKHI